MQLNLILIYVTYNFHCPEKSYLLHLLPSIFPYQDTSGDAQIILLGKKRNSRGESIGWEPQRIPLFFFALYVPDTLILDHIMEKKHGKQNSLDESHREPPYATDSAVIKKRR